MSQHWDELASAHIDGEASADEVARLEDHADGLTALSDLRRVAEANADVPAPPPGLRDRQLGAALDLFDQLGVASDADVTPAVRELPRTDTRSSAEPPTTRPQGTVVEFRRRRVATWLGSAAAAVVVVAGVSLAMSRIDSSSDSSTESADAASSPSANLERSEAAALAEDGSQDQRSAEMATAMADPAGDDAGGAEAEAAMDAADASETTSTTAAKAPGADQADLAPVEELTSGDDLFAVAARLLEDDQMSPDPDTAAGGQLAALQVRCPDDFEGFGNPSAAPILFDGTPATLVLSSSPVERIMVITRECKVLVAVERP